MHVEKFFCNWDSEIDTGARLVPLTPYDDIDTRPAAVNRIGVAVAGDTHVFHINGEQVTRIQDDTLTEQNRFGFYMRAGIEDTETLPMIVRFDDLAYWDLDKPE